MDKEIKHYFSKHYAQMNNIDMYSEESINKWLDSNYSYFNSTVPHFIKLLKNLKILELGCGIGGFLYFLEKNNITDYLGVDASEEQLEICRKYVTQKIINDDAIQFLRNNTVKYDLIVMYDFIEHINYDQILNLLKLIYDSLNFNGKVIVRTPNMSIPLASHNRYIDFTHKIGFTEQSITQIFSEQNFSEIKVLNDLTTKKRLFLMKIIQRFFEKIYNIEHTDIFTRNLVLLAIK